MMVQLKNITDVIQPIGTHYIKNGIKKKLKILTFFLVLTLFPLINAVTLNSGNIIHSNGLNSNITLTFDITFDKLEVLSNAITFYNLTYTNPSSCNSTQSSYSVYNHSTSNSVFNLPSVACIEEDGGRATIILPELNETEDVQNKTTIIEDFKDEDWDKLKEKLDSPWILAIILVVIVFIIIFYNLLNRKSQ